MGDDLKNLKIIANIEAEKTLLSQIMIDNSIMLFCSDIRQAHFYDNSLGKVFKEMKKLHKEKKSIDTVTLSEVIEDTDLLFEIAGYAMTTGNYSDYINILIKNLRLREAIKLSTKIRAMATAKEDIHVLNKEMKSFIDGSHGEEKSIELIGNCMADRYEEYTELSDGSEESRKKGVCKTGFQELDKYLNGGLKPGHFNIIGGRAGMGKCHGKGTKIIMYDGTIKNVEDIIEGDLLMGDDSTPRNVLSLARGKEEMYEIMPNSAENYTINKSHILSLRKSGEEGLQDKGHIEDISFTEYITKSNKWKKNYKGYKLPFNFDKSFYKEQIIDPYLLGLWLGDGSLNSNVIHNGDIEIQERLREYIKSDDSIILKEREQPGCIEFRLSPLSKANKDIKKGFGAKLSSIGVLGNKHIPDEYKITSKENRLKILAGLLDTDGYLQSDTGFEIVQKSERLIDDIKYIADSLGYRTSKKLKIAKIKSTGFVGKYYRLMISGDTREIPTKVKRKQVKIGSQFGIVGVNSGFKIRELGVGDYYGFTLDGNHRYLLQDGTVTHNTACSLSLAYNVAKQKGKSVAFFSAEMPKSQLIDRLVSMATGIPSTRILSGNLSQDDLSLISSKMDGFMKLNLYIDDTSCTTVDKIEASILRLDKRPDVVIIDYIQLMSGGNKKDINRATEISEITRELKKIALTYKICVIGLAQVNRGVENNLDKRPMLSHLKSSGGVEENADAVIMVYREGYYDEYTDNKDVVELIIRKNRHGSLGTVEVGFNNGTIYELKK